MPLRNVLTTITLTSMVLLPGLAQAAFTQQEATAKGTQLSQMLQTKLSQDPVTAQAIIDEDATGYAIISAKDNVRRRGRLGRSVQRV